MPIFPSRPCRQRIVAVGSQPTQSTAVSSITCPSPHCRGGFPTHLYNQEKVGNSDLAGDDVLMRQTLGSPPYTAHAGRRLAYLGDRPVIEDDPKLRTLKTPTNS